MQGYAKHEREVLEGVSQARAAAMANNGSPSSQARDENQLIRGAAATAGRGGELSRPEGQPELLGASDGAGQHRRPDSALAAILQRQRPRLSESAPDFPVESGRGAFHFPPREFFEIEDASQREAPASAVGLERCFSSQARTRHGGTMLTA